MYLRARKEFGRRTGQNNVSSKTCCESRESRELLQEEYSHVISFKEHAGPVRCNGGVQGSCAWSLCPPRHSSGPAHSEVGALRRVFFPLPQHNREWCATTGVASVEQRTGIESARSRRQRHLQFQPLVRIHTRRQQAIA